ncbi:hypothetical protein [Vibrio gazogenes]|uniref:hypothetical protein n=1 Tax=Vibrio gazogenes TaxID=687 RepID=UPI0035218372
MTAFPESMTFSVEAVPSPDQDRNTSYLAPEFFAAQVLTLYCLPLRQFSLVQAV